MEVLKWRVWSSQWVEDIRKFKKFIKISGRQISKINKMNKNKRYPKILCCIYKYRELNKLILNIRGTRTANRSKNMFEMTRNINQGVIKNKSMSKTYKIYNVKKIVL